MGREKANHRGGWVLGVCIWTFGLAICLGLASQVILARIGSLAVSFFILIVVVFLGIGFDLIGTAATAAKQSPLNAKASRKIPGSREAVNLLKQAGKVANFCNDVVGDISGIVSGTLAALIALRITTYYWPRTEQGAGIYLNIILTALVAAFTVGGKAMGKTLAINKSTEILLFVGRVISKLGELAGLLTLRRQRDR